MTLISADEARSRVPAYRVALVNEAIEDAVVRGLYRCALPFMLSDHEQQIWIDLGYNIDVLSQNMSYICWFPAEEDV